ncbi:MAG: type III pantothenate kinase [Candidatus Margulisiibacteriota bacterium]|jgi:type III pantothenate kinase
MILTIDVGNTNIVYGLFEGPKLVATWRTPTAPYIYRKIKGNIAQVIIASVVPAVNRKLAKDIKQHYGLVPRFVSAADIPLIKVKLSDKKAIGADRVVNALAAYTLYNRPALIIDFGTATTFDYVSAKGEYLGGAIAPGITLARDTLHQRTAKLPSVPIVAPKRVVGRSTVEALQSGLVFGYVAMVEGMVKRIKSELSNSNARMTNARMTVIATGGLAKLICKYTPVVDIIDLDLTLKGLRIIAEKKLSTCG